MCIFTRPGKFHNKTTFKKYRQRRLLFLLLNNKIQSFQFLKTSLTKMLARRVNKKVNGPKNQKISEKEDKKY